MPTFDPKLTGSLPRSPLQEKLRRGSKITDPLSVNYRDRKITPPDNSLTKHPFLKLHNNFLVSGIIYASSTVTTIAGNSSGVLANTSGANLLPTLISRNNSVSDNVGNIFRIWACGTYTTDDAVAQVQITADSSGSTNLYTITSPAGVVTNAPWSINNIIIVNTVGSSGTVESFVEAKINNTNLDAASTSTFSINTTVRTNHIYTLSVSWSGGSAGDNIKIRQFIVELLN